MLTNLTHEETMQLDAELDSILEQIATHQTPTTQPTLDSILAQIDNLDEHQCLLTARLFDRLIVQDVLP